MITVSAVSYLNTLPFVYGLSRSETLQNVRLELKVPSACAQDLAENKTDIALVPVGALPNLPSYHIIGNHCIGSTGEVKTVLLMSHVPLNSIKRVFLDPDSRTSVKLATILARDFWGIKPQWLPMSSMPELASESDAMVAIGDKTFGMRKNFQYIFDLSTEWLQMTGLPFVFAVWASTNPIADSVVREFDEALRWGISNINEAVAGSPQMLVSRQEALDYLTNAISYVLDDPKRQAMKQFLSLIE